MSSALVDGVLGGYRCVMDKDKPWKVLESLTVIDRAGDAVQRALRPVIGEGTARDVLGGKWLGHPLHPALVMIPVGAWSSAVALDWMGTSRAAARRLVGLGTLAAPAAIVTGWSDWSTLNAEQRRVGLVHAAANATAVSLFSLSYWRRRSRTDNVARLTAVAGLLAAGTGGAIGGHLVFRQRAGVDVFHPELATGPEYDPAQLPEAMEQASGLRD
jgi:uncharacterized membrane protein